MFKFAHNRSRTKVPISASIYDLLKRMVCIVGLEMDADEFLFMRANSFFKDPTQQREMFSNVDVLQGFRRTINM